MEEAGGITAMEVPEAMDVPAPVRDVPVPAPVPEGEEPAAAGRIFIIVNNKGRKRRMTLGEVCLLTNQVTRLAGFYKWLLHVENDSDDGEDHGLHSSNITRAFTAENVDQEYERLLEKGVEICEKPVSRPWGARNMSFYDPDGNLVYIRSFPK